ncbi:MAG TPA: hypothetical protein VFF06_14025 [Polyangia bacterium]|nr:hypothetical protein [Polyangia bacterium]
MLPLILALRRQRRADHHVFIDAALALLRSPEAPPALLRSLAAKEPTVRREAFKLAFESGSFDAELFHRALDDRDVIVRVEAARHLPRVVEGAARRELLERGLRDGSALVRGAVAKLLDGEPEAWRRAAYDLLLYDARPTLRASARAALAALVSDFDAARSYRTALTTATTLSRLRGAILGLADCGVEEDVLLFAPFFLDRRVRIRVAALQAAAALDRDSVSPFLEALSDPSKRVSRAAARVLEKRSRAGVADLLLAVAENADAPQHALVHAVDVLCSLAPWTRLLSLLRATASPQRDFAATATRRIDYSTTTVVVGTIEEIEAIERALANASLSTEHRAWIEQQLRFWRQRMR